jgi:TRAP-type uncharacterized transport system substrate-binding protein
MTRHHKETTMLDLSNTGRRRLVTGLVTTVACVAFPAAASAQGAPAKVTLAGGSVGGAWSAVGTAIGETLRKEYPGISFTYEPGREAGNLVLVSQGKVPARPKPASSPSPNP